MSSLHGVRTAGKQASHSWAFLTAVQFSYLLKTEAAWLNPCWARWDHNRYPHTMSSWMNLLDPSVPEWWCNGWKPLMANVAIRRLPAWLTGTLFTVRLLFWEVHSIPVAGLGVSYYPYTWCVVRLILSGWNLVKGKECVSVMTLMRPEQALWGFWMRSTVSVCNVFSTDLQTWMNSSLLNSMWGSNHFNIFMRPVALWSSPLKIFFTVLL